jgi:hypothetical protein
MCCGIRGIKVHFRASLLHDLMDVYAPLHAQASLPDVFFSVDVVENFTAR